MAAPITFGSPRLVEPPDFHACVDLADTAKEFASDDQRRMLFEFWKLLLTNHVAQSAVVDAVGEKGTWIASFAMSVWVKDEFLTWVKSSEMMGSDQSILFNLISSSRNDLVISDQKALRSGFLHRKLNLFVCHFAIDEAALGESSGAVAGTMLIDLSNTHTGYAIRSFMKEVDSPKDKALMENVLRCRPTDRKGRHSWLMERHKLKPGQESHRKITTPIDALFSEAETSNILRPEDRELIYCLAREQSVEDIGAILGCGVEGAKKRLTRLRTRLMERVTELPSGIFDHGKQRDHNWQRKVGAHYAAYPRQLRPSPNLVAHKWRVSEYPKR